MLTTKESIERRRSIRKFKDKSVPEEHIMELIEAARLAPSGCNAQPWRFKIVKDNETKMKLVEASHNQTFIGQAPVVLVCCADVSDYIDGSASGIQDLGKIGAVEDNIVNIICRNVDEMKKMSISEISQRIAANVAIAIEHIALRALDFDLGTCWIRALEEDKIRNIFGWDENIYPVALLPVGYPDEDPAPRKRLKIEDIIIY
ncbi:MULTISPECIES: nitroreductase family protein [Methanobacterium]|jgi:nitroreductase|uniref:Nitroreductase family protein n=1 Tax=Methanobacterium veterum TaxID=408577 RepID=A0A9E4ZVP8_9EURY|nr:MULTISPECIES: nitroreductase family protein [Methanobacterium]MCZ3366124.1 nitroreductase family protein [Methanobacterium veterum]MCZ3371648.1 nitroreductase family protein [Methanobacterium veterum]